MRTDAPKTALAFCAALGASFAAMEAYASHRRPKSVPQVLLILGCRVRGDVAEPTLRMRADAAAQLLLAHPDVLAVACGGIVHDDQTKSEAAAIREILLSHGVPEAQILTEDQSKTTLENFCNAKALLARCGRADDTVAFLTSEFHVLRATFIGRIAGVRAEGVPAPSPKKQKCKNYLREALVFPLLLSELPKIKRR